MIGNKYNKTLSPDQVAQAIKFTTVKPRERMEFIRKIQFLRPSTNPALTAWGMEFENDTMKVEARTLDPPVIKLKGSAAPELQRIFADIVIQWTLSIRSNYVNCQHVCSVSI